MNMARLLAQLAICEEVCEPFTHEVEKVAPTEANIADYEWTLVDHLVISPLRAPSGSGSASALRTFTAGVVSSQTLKDFGIDTGVFVILKGNTQEEQFIIKEITDKSVNL